MVVCCWVESVGEWGVLLRAACRIHRREVVHVVQGRIKVSA